MQLRFRTRKLERMYEFFKEAVREVGPEVARRYVQRVTLIQLARSFEEVKKLPGLRVHPLKGERKGQWAANLTDRWRLVFTLEGSDFEVICIEEVSHHYGD